MTESNLVGSKPEAHVIAANQIVETILQFPQDVQNQVFDIVCEMLAANRSEAVEKAHANLKFHEAMFDFLTNRLIPLAPRVEK